MEFKKLRQKFTECNLATFAIEGHTSFYLVFFLLIRI